MALCTAALHSLFFPAVADPLVFCGCAGKGIQIRMDFAKAPNNPAMTAINATVVTNQPSVTDFTMQAAVPKYLRMQMSPASSTSMPPNITQVRTARRRHRLATFGGLSVRVVQVIKLINSEHGSKPIQLKLKVRSLFSPSRRFSFVCSYSC